MPGRSSRGSAVIVAAAAAVAGLGACGKAKPAATILAHGATMDTSPNTRSGIALYLSVGSLRNSGKVPFRIDGVEPVLTVGHPRIDAVRLQKRRWGFGLARSYDPRDYVFSRLTRPSEWLVAPGRVAGIIVKLHGLPTDQRVGIGGVRVKLRAENGGTRTVVFPNGAMKCVKRCGGADERLFRALDGLPKS
jgi:hypothetical protein